LTENFFRSLAQSFGCTLTIKKVRGDNAHHIVEATFKSFARCLRRVIDHFFPFTCKELAIEAKHRAASQTRSTKETMIETSLDLDLPPNNVPKDVSTGIATLDMLLREFVSSANIYLRVQCSGDLWIDEHHSSEDVMITIGKVLSTALGDRGGLNRMGSASSSSGNAKVHCVLDLSNRPSFCSDLRLQDGDDSVGDLPVEMIVHGFESLVMNSLTTAHFVQLGDGSDPADFSTKDVVIAAARALGAAFGQCATVDPRRAGIAASSKGTLSK